ncbi:hypothetical protein D9615_010188 [Tricholomella constricta]|uniref:Uncharacterized protein n=1 Tax=Tricholomella constricta TaxID=117010 RepID=A0A8H5LSU3_9AGAR|nr:hypothetical protein D9615_010188 [Tricholomella constricta]
MASHVTRSNNYGQLDPVGLKTKGSNVASEIKSLRFILRPHGLPRPEVNRVGLRQHRSLGLALVALLSRRPRPFRLALVTRSRSPQAASVSRRALSLCTLGTGGLELWQPPPGGAAALNAGPACIIMHYDDDDDDTTIWRNPPAPHSARTRRTRPTRRPVMRKLEDLMRKLEDLMRKLEDLMRKLDDLMVGRQLPSVAPQTVASRHSFSTPRRTQNPPEPTSATRETSWPRTVRKPTQSTPQMIGTTHTALGSAAITPPPAPDTTTCRHDNHDGGKLNTTTPHTRSRHHATRPPHTC